MLPPRWPDDHDVVLLQAQARALHANPHSQGDAPSYLAAQLHYPLVHVDPTGSSVIDYNLLVWFTFYFDLEKQNNFVLIS